MRSHKLRTAAGLQSHGIWRLTRVSVFFVVRHLDDTREVLGFTTVLFASRTLIFQAGNRRLVKMYQWLVPIDLARNSLPTHSVIFTEVKNAKFGSFRHQSHLKRSGFEMELIIVGLKLKQALRAKMIGLNIDSYISPILPRNI